MLQDKPVGERLWALAIWALVIFFIVNVIATIAAVGVDSFGTRWFNSWLPAAFTTRWYKAAWDEFQLHDVLIVTFEVVGAVVLLSGLLGVPAAYALARRNFPGKQLVILLFLLPMMIPPITFGIPLATVLYQAHFGGNMSGVILVTTRRGKAPGRQVQGGGRHTGSSNRQDPPLRFVLLKVSTSGRGMQV